MIQGYILSIAYLLFSALLLLLDNHREHLSFLLKARARLEDDCKVLNLYFYSGIAIAILVLFFPIAPGPVVLGDLLVVLFICLCAFHFKLKLSERNKARSNLYFSQYNKNAQRLGYATIAVAMLHFILPSFVIL